MCLVQPPLELLPGKLLIWVDYHHRLRITTDCLFSIHLSDQEDHSNASPAVAQPLGPMAVGSDIDMLCVVLHLRFAPNMQRFAIDHADHYRGFETL